MSAEKKRYALETQLIESIKVDFIKLDALFDELTETLKDLREHNARDSDEESRISGNQAIAYQETQNRSMELVGKITESLAKACLLQHSKTIDHLNELSDEFNAFKKDLKPMIEAKQAATTAWQWRKFFAWLFKTLGVAVLAMAGIITFLKNN